MINEWKDIKTAPKEPLHEHGSYGKWVLGADKREIRVMRWTTAYPETKGCWMYASAPTDYIDDILSFEPTHWMELPELPKD